MPYGIGKGSGSPVIMGGKLCMKLHCLVVHPSHFLANTSVLLKQQYGKLLEKG